jgi:uncharacterized protein
MGKKLIIEIIKAYLKQLNQAGITIDKAFLYGSCARGETTDNCDINIMPVSSLFDNSGSEANINVWSFTRKIDTRIEPYSVGMQQYLNDDISPLLQIVKKEGIEIKIENF